MKKLAVFISGFGSNLQTIAEFCQQNPNFAQIHVVISNKPNVNGLKIAESFGIPSVVIPTKGIKIEDFESQCENHLNGVDLICLAGFMRFLSQYFTTKCHNKMINIHPSLLPSFKGSHALQDAISFGVKITGCTVHFVEKEIDAGEIIIQEAIVIENFDNEQTLRTKMQIAEQTAYTKALKQIIGVN